MKATDIFGIGSPLIDIFIEVEEAVILSMGIKKSNLNLVDEKKSLKILSAFHTQKIKATSGDSTANTMSGAAGLSLSTAFLGKTGTDKYADMFISDLEKKGIVSKVVKHSTLPTGTALTLVTPDKERTFIVNLGAAAHLLPEDLKEDYIISSKIFHTTAYQLEDSNLKNTVVKASETAKKSSTLISIDLADPGLIARNLSFLKQFTKENADILFLNREEAEAFTGISDEQKAMQALKHYAGIVCLKLGPEGSLISEKGHIHKIKPYRVDAKDTTGAGDIYAAAILYGIIKGISMQRSGELASLAASKIVCQVGGRLNCSLLEHQDIKEILTSGLP